MYLWNYQFSKIPPKNLIDFCPERLFRIGMLCTQLSRVALRIIKTNHIHLVYKTFQGRNLSNVSVVFWKIDNSINTFWHYLTFIYEIIHLKVFFKILLRIFHQFQVLSLSHSRPGHFGAIPSICNQRSLDYFGGIFCLFFTP